MAGSEFEERKTNLALGVLTKKVVARRIELEAPANRGVRDLLERCLLSLPTHLEQGVVAGISAGEAQVLLREKALAWASASGESLRVLLALTLPQSWRA